MLRKIGKNRNLTPCVNAGSCPSVCLPDEYSTYEHSRLTINVCATGYHYQEIRQRRSTHWMDFKRLGNEDVICI